MKLYVQVFLIMVCYSNIPVYGQTKFDITVFGTDEISSYELVSVFNEELDTLFQLYKNDTDRYEVNRDSLSSRFYQLGNFSYINIDFFTSYTNKVDLIIDFVENEDTERRLNFRKISAVEFPGLEDLFETWKEYESLSFELFRRGEINDMSCPVIHCLWSFNHVRLEPYLSVFNDRAFEEVDQLTKALNSSSLAKHRASSSYLLSHAGLGEQELLNILLPSTMDSSSLVRNNSMRVIYYILKERPELDVDIDRIINVLNYPSFTDRNKALVVLRSLPLENMDMESLKKMVPALIEILEKKDAHNFRNAHLVLQKISGLEYSYNAISEWKSWAAPYL